MITRWRGVTNQDPLRRPMGHHWQVVIANYEHVSCIMAYCSSGFDLAAMVDADRKNRRGIVDCWKRANDH